ncbi:MAG: ACT domain-containing protein [Deltaproteobacteria bacterium]|nr:ACT domain-containing protein [Deltaproteobacteria bacterium]
MNARTRTEIRLFLKNRPGELARLATILSENAINIEAMTIQDASEYVRELFQARGRSIRRIASVGNYNAMRKDSVEYALIRCLVDKTDEAVDLLSKNEYVFDVIPVLTLELDNRPGILAKMADMFGAEGININYVYGSGLPGAERALYVFCPEDLDLAARILKDAKL